MGYAFISYSSKNRKMADSLNAILAKKGIKTWIAPDNIPVGATYASSINCAIREASCFVLLFSESAQGSNWVYKETERAVNYGKTIFTIFLDDVQKNDAFELMISSNQAVTIRKIDDNDEKINQLIAEIKKYTDKKLSDGASTQLLASTKESTEAKVPVEQKQENIDSESKAYFEKNAVMDGSTLIEFKGRDSASVVIPEGVTDIWASAFASYSELKCISIPSTVTRISGYAFIDCPNLQSISVSPKNPIFFSENNCCIERNTNRLVLGCSKSIIPDSVTVIGKRAFNYCKNLTKIEIPSNIIRIEVGAFSCCDNLAEIKISASVATIAEGAFNLCKNLQSIQVSAQNPTYYAENNCCIEIKTHRLIIGCKNSIIPEGIVSIATGAFSGCSGLTDVNLPFGITEIETSAFFRCTNLTEIKISASVTKIADLAFERCENLQSIQVSDQNSAYYSENNCCIETKTHCLIIGCGNSIIPEGVISIAQSVFSFCKGLTNIRLPYGLVEIKERAFLNCSALCCIHLPRSIKYIGALSLLGCDNLTNIVIPGSVSYIGRFAFSKSPSKLSSNRKKIFCEFSRKPDGWDENWTDKYSDVYWKDEWYYDENGNPVVKS